MLSIAQLKVRDAIYNLIQAEYAHLDAPIPLESCSPEDITLHQKEVEARRAKCIKRTDEMVKMLVILGLKK